MRVNLTTFIVLIVALHVSASSFGQKISISHKNAHLTDVLNDIRKQTGYEFIFSSSTLKGTNRVNLSVKDVELKEVLSVIFRDQPLEFSIENRSVIVTRKENSLFDKFFNLFAEIDVKGRVVDEMGKPLPGATISVVLTDFSKTKRPETSQIQLRAKKRLL